MARVYAHINKDYTWVTIYNLIIFSVGISTCWLSHTNLVILYMTKSYKKLLKKKVAFVFFESLRVVASSELVEAPRLSSDNVEQ